MIPLVIVACVLGVLGIVAAVVVGFRSRLAISVLRDEIVAPACPRIPEWLPQRAKPASRK